MKSITKGEYKAAFDQIRIAKLRNFWTMLGIIIGVASVILVIAISVGIRRQITGHINNTGSDIITVEPQTIHTSGSTLNSLALLSSLQISGSLTQTDISRVANTKGVSEVAPISVMSDPVSGNANLSYKNGLVIGTSPDFAQIMHQGLSSGNFLSSAQGVSNPVVLGAQAAADLFNENIPDGQTLTVNGRQFVVVGVLNNFPATPLNSSAQFNKAVFINYGQARSMTDGTVTTYEILAKPSSPLHTKSVEKLIYQRLLASHGGQQDFKVLDEQQTLTNSNQVLTLVTHMIEGVAAISLLVGGIGIMNVMLVSVTERMHEIGIRKALGATNQQILHQFIVESSVLSFIGGIIGVVLAIVVDLLLRFATNLRPAISWELVVGACVVSVAIGIVFGSFPALKAAKKEPIDALRAE